MAVFDSNDPRDEVLWRLLGRARAVEASPYFSRKVLRAIEAAPEPQSGWWQLVCRAFAPATVCVALAVLALAGLGLGERNAPAVANADLEFETIQNLDLLVFNYESSLWLDPSSSSR
jgi:hypothetical protein